MRHRRHAHHAAAHHGGSVKSQYVKHLLAHGKFKLGKVRRASRDLRAHHAVYAHKWPRLRKSGRFSSYAAKRSEKRL